MSRGSIGTRDWTARFETAVWMVLLPVSLVIYDPGLPMPFRHAKELFQMPLLSLLIAMALWRQGRWGSGRRILDGLVLITGAAWVAAFWISPDRVAGGWKLMNILLYLAVFVYLRNFLARRQEFRAPIMILLIAAGITSLYAIFQYLGLDPLFQLTQSSHAADRRWAVSGFTGQQTLFAGVIGPLVPLGVTGILAARRILTRSLMVLVTALITSAVVLTHTRAVFLGLVIAFITGALVFLARGGGRARRGFLAAMILVPVFMIGSATAIPSMRHRMADGFNLNSSSIRARIHYWTSSMRLIQQKPLTGHGLGSFAWVYPEAQARVLARDAHPEYWGAEVVTHPHNEWIYVLTEGGLMVFIPVLLLSTYVLAGGIRRCVSAAGNAEFMLRMGVLMGWLVIWVDAGFSFPLHIGTSALFFIVFSALLTYDREEVSPGIDSKEQLE